jgi:hypothetical protein
MKWEEEWKWLEKRFHPSLGIPLIITRRVRKEVKKRIWSFPSLFRDSSDHHSHVPQDGAGSPSPRFHPSLGIPLIITLGLPDWAPAPWL